MKLLNVMTGGLAACLLLGTGCGPAPKIQPPASTPSPTPAAIETPAPVAETPEPAATPEPTPETVETPVPTPTPPSLTLAELARDPKAWPRVVVTRERLPFAILRNGVPAGEMEVPAGTEVQLLKVEPTRVQVSFQGAVKAVQAAQTDLLERAERLPRLAPSGPTEVAAPAPAPPPARGTTKEISVVTWNIQFFPGKYREASAKAQEDHIQEVRTILAKMNPDILMIEELRDPDALEKATTAIPDYDIHIVSRFKYGDELADQQVAIASRFKADSAFAEPWKYAPHTPPRGFAFAAIELGGTTLLTYAVHLKSNRGDDDAERLENIAKREESARQLVAHMNDLEKTYRGKGRKVAMVVGGDFNLLETPEYAEEQTTKILRDAGLKWCWEGVPLTKRITWPPRGSFAGASFDHFFYRGLTQVKVGLLDQKNASDHRPVEMVFRLE